MANERSVDKSALIDLLKRALAGLDADQKHVSAALVAEAIAQLETDTGSG